MWHHWGMTADTNLSTTVRALAAARQMSQADVAKAAGLTRSTFDRRLAQGGWTVAEAERLAEIFDVDLSELLTGLDGHLVGG